MLVKQPIYKDFDNEVLASIPSALASAVMSDSYVASVNDEIEKLVKDLNSFESFMTASNVLKGDVAEFWHTGTYNIDSALKGSSNRAFVNGRLFVDLGSKQVEN